MATASGAGPLATASEEQIYEGYCMKCKCKREFAAETTETFKSRGGPRRSAKGPCPVCGTAIYRLLAKEAPAVEA